MMTVDGLKPGTTYVFRVRAKTDGGYGSYGGEIELETSHEGKDILINICLLEMRILFIFNIVIFETIFLVFKLSTTCTSNTNLSVKINPN